MTGNGGTLKRTIELFLAENRYVSVSPVLNSFAGSVNVQQYPYPPNLIVVQSPDQRFSNIGLV